VRCGSSRWAEALDLAIGNPLAVVVTPDGDRFGPTGWRIGAAGSGATGSALEEAQHQATAAAEAAEAAADALRQARAALAEVRSAAAQADKARDQAVNRVRSLGDAMARLERDTPESAAELARIDAHLGELAERAQRQASRRAELEQRLPELEAAEAELAARAKRQAEARRALEAETARVRQLRSALDVRVAARDERRRMLESRIAKVDERLDRHQVERREAEQRRLELDARADATDVLAEFVTSRTAQVEVVLEELRAARRRYTERTRAVTAELEERRRERAALESRLTEHRERMSRAEIGEAEVRMRLEAATAACRHELDVEPEAAIEAPCPELAEGATPAARVRDLERELRVMGPINPLALEEFAALQERHRFLEEPARGRAHDATRAGEGHQGGRRRDRQRVRLGFRRRVAELHQPVRDAVPRRCGSLTLTDPDDLLSPASRSRPSPSGKNVKKLSLLSGGERSLTALAYLFAVFRSRPSPFYVMDEVEAALDDVNLHRFLGLIARVPARRRSCSSSATRSARWRPPTPAVRRHHGAGRFVEGARPRRSAPSDPSSSKHGRAR
jgi:chromosome segregation protein